MDIRDGKAQNVYSYMRWSSEPQNWGDSERRQEQLAKDWCQRNGRKLADQTFTDRGVSGWHGDNRKGGALGALLKMVKAGDTILIEDCDRWSRESALDSMGALRDTVDKGVQIVFLKTGIVVNHSNFNDPNVLIPTFFSSYLANAENEKRSYRIRQAMDARREQVKSGKAVQGRLPAWLEWHRKLNKPVVIKEKAALVRWIFALCLEGKGVRAIERLLQKTPPISNSKRAIWNTRFIHRLLKDKAVLGWHTASQTAGVFPAIVSEQVFYAAASKLENRKKLTVREAHADSNMFTGLLRCAQCGHTLVRHSTRANGSCYTYLLCSGHLRGLSKCSAKGVVYDQFEASILSLLTEADLMRSALSGSKHNSELDSINGQLAEVEKQASKILGLIDGEDAPPKRLMEKLQRLEAQERSLRDQAEIEKAKAAIPAELAYERLNTELAGQMSDPRVRAQVRESLRDIVDRIDIDRVQNSYSVRLKGSNQPIEVMLNKFGWVFSPAPLWATDNVRFNQKAAAGEYTNQI